MTGWKGKRGGRLRDDMQTEGEKGEGLISSHFVKGLS